MDRAEQIAKISDETRIWDMVVIGGGATGLGIAVDAALRGFQVALFEQHDFATSTSSRSTKLVHGGVRYLKNGDIPLVREALIERGRLRQNAPHLVKNQSFVIPNYSHFDNVLYTVGLTLYDVLSWGGLSFGRSLLIGKKKTSACLPTIKTRGLKGGVMYHDGQFDDARMALCLAQSCADKGGCPVNYMKVTGIIHTENGKVAGVRVTDLEQGREFEVRAKSVINATGVFVDDVIRMDLPGSQKMVQPSQGIHLVFDSSFLSGNHALMIPKTSDGRVLFAVPWRGKVVVGTTDTVRESPDLEPRPLDEEIEFILNTAALYMTKKPERKDVLSVFAAQRPLAAPRNVGKSTKEISRSHKIFVSDNNLISITGGKWTTYRKMAEDTIDKAISLGLVPPAKCTSRNFRIHGYSRNGENSDHLNLYGSDKKAIEELIGSSPAMAEKIHPSFSFTAAEVVWAVRNEMARSVEDILSRRNRLLFLDARAARDAAEKVARIMAGEMNKSQDWITQQTESFHKLAEGYIL